MPSARTHSKALQDADLQSARPNRTTSQRPNMRLVQRTAAVLRPTDYQPQQYPLALPAPPQRKPNSSSSGPVIQAINTLENLLIATLDSINNIDVNNVDVMIDSGAATHVCPPWFGNEFPLNSLTENEKPNLISGTNTQIPVYGYRWIHFNNENGQSVVSVPGETTYPIRVTHQGFEVNFNSDTLEVKHKESCNSALRNRNGLFYIRLRKATMPQGMQLRLETVEDKQVAMIAPTTMTPRGPQVMRGGYTDIWAMNNEGYLVRIHKRLRKALFTPFNTDCPIPADQLENYRKTVVRQPGQPQRIVTDSFQTLTKQQQNRLVEGQAWIGETWFKPKATARPVTTAMPNTTAKAIEAEHKAKTTTATPQDKQAEAQQPKQTQAPATRHTGKQTQKEPTIPSTTEVDKTNDYWIKGGRTAYYLPTQSDGGPNYDNLLPTRMTMVNPTNGSRGKRVDDNWTQQNRNQKNQRKGQGQQILRPHTCQHHRKYKSTTSRTFHIETGVQFVFVAKDEQQTIHHNAANSLSYKWTWHTSKHTTRSQPRY